MLTFELYCALFCYVPHLTIWIWRCSNPDQSKHLETARMCLFDLWIDFVNLRCEDYSENSRIPTMVCSFSFFFLESFSLSFTIFAKTMALLGRIKHICARACIFNLYEQYVWWVCIHAMLFLPFFLSFHGGGLDLCMEVLLFCVCMEYLTHLMRLSFSLCSLQKFGTAEEDAYRRDLTINRYVLCVIR